MPQFGTGVLPSGAVGTELSYITRRGFIPKMVVQLYNASPLFACLLANAQNASGGVSPITVPVQGAAYVNPAWTDYSGSFASPSVQQGAYNAEFNLKALVVPIPFLGMEGLVQVSEAVIPRIEAVMNDATNGAIDNLSTAIYGNYSNNQQIIGLPGMIDDGTTLTTYGGLSRSANTWWQSKRYTASAAPTRNLILQYVVGTVKNCGEKPTFGVTGPGTWHLLATDFVSNERYLISPDGNYADEQGGVARAAFQALMVAGVPIYLDPYATEGILYLYNENYDSLYVHENAAFAFTGFESTLPNFQIGYIGAVLTLLELVSAKPKSNTVVGSLSYTTL